MQITNAMELVASSKLRRAKQKAKTGRPFFDAQYQMLTELAQQHIGLETVFTQKRDVVKNRLFIVIAGDRGMAGGYNSGMFKLVAAAHKDQPVPKIIAIGKKSVEYFEKRGYEVISKYVGLAENVKNAYCADIAGTAIRMFRRGEVDEVLLFYTQFVSSMVQKAADIPLLPIDTPPLEQNAGSKSRLLNYDPNPEAVFNRIVPNFLMSLVQCAVSESYASEQCARRIAMENASDNAAEMIGRLSLLYNRARQEKITNEINEIVGGANALS
jgi:F-type H+-transporting ATPase subunit gamma